MAPPRKKTKNPAGISPNQYAEQTFDPITTRMLAEDKARAFGFGIGIDQPLHTIYTSSGLPNARQVAVTGNFPSNVSAFVYNPSGSHLPKGAKKAEMDHVLFLHGKGLQGLSREEIQQIKAHEIEHLLSRQNLPEGVSFNQMFDTLYGDTTGSQRKKFVEAMIEHAPYLRKKYGMFGYGYFDKDRANQLTNGDIAGLLDEQFASLSALEVTKNVNLTKDPVLRKTIFADPAMRETYNAMTGLRQTRMDARSLEPYTRYPEVEPVPSRVYPEEPPKGFLDRLKGLLF